MTRHLTSRVASPLTGKMLARLALIDLIGVPLLVIFYIWRFQFTWPQVWIILPLWFVLSAALHHDTPKTLGWRADNLGPATRNAAIALAIMAAGLLVTGLILGQPLRIPRHLLSLRRLWSYFAFCLLQQVILNSFISNRMLSVVRRRWLACLLVGGIFAVAHWPNPVLIPLTLIAGAVMAWLFARHRNIMPLAVMQALLGSLAWWSFPVAWHHRLRVGPGFYNLH